MNRLDRRARLIARVRQGYRLAFGSNGPDPKRFVAAPGRVNLIGEHVDYNDGIVLPCAINRETMVALGSGPEVGGRGYVEAVAIDMGQAREKIALYEPIERAENTWQNLLRGAVAFLQRRGHEVLPTRLAIAGDIPIGAGLSSSASFTLAVTLALAKVSRIALAPEELAKIAQDAENTYAGTQCGIMDPMACAASEEGSALLIDCRTLERMPIPVSPKLAVMIIDTGIRRQLTTSAFNERRRECETVAAHFGLKALRDLQMPALESAKADLEAHLYARARHVVNEIARVEPTAVALSQGDTAALAQLMRASHASLRDNYEVTVPAVDQLVEIVSGELGKGDEALGGVRMTGAGFGGSIVAVVDEAATNLVIDAVERVYNPTADVPASAEVYTLTGGAREVTPA
ncbi:MAG: galactokinase [Pseudomonadota bacterium]